MSETALANPQLALPIGDVFVETHLALPPEKRIYTNRSLRLDQIDWAGFDMDYTLAIYAQAEMDRLSIEVTAKKLVELGYPESILTMPFRADFGMRGLIVDKKLGNILKMDRYRYVKRAYHGMRELTRDERRALYHSQRVRPGTERYHWVDTLYATSEVSVFTAVVDELERSGATEPPDYAQLFSDVRMCIDLAHQDGSILNEVLRDLPRYVRRDPELAATLHKLRSTGKKLFLLTNSRPEYTHTLMTYLLADLHGEYDSWQQYFDLVIASARKPGFFNGSASPFSELMPDGTNRVVTETETLERGRIYTGGGLVALERQLGVPGDRILYIGDHIYGDVLRAKKETAWRTAMIIQELGDELAAHAHHARDLERMDALNVARDALYVEMRSRHRRTRDLERRISEGYDRDLDAGRMRERRAIERLRNRIRAIDEEFDSIESRVDKAFHPFWGSLFMAGPELTIFGDQVEQYACLYTERVSNFGYTSPMHYFRSTRHRMPHEM